MARLYVLTGPDLGRSFELADGHALGRDAANQVVLRDGSISRRHARFECSAGKWRVVDTGSRNGLHHGGRRVEALELADGVEFQLGEVALRFRDEAAAVVAESPPPRAPAVTDEIVLEGEWSDPPPVAPPVRASAPARELERTTLRPPAPAPARPPPAAARNAPAPGVAAASRGVLQYNKVEAREGFAESDLAQQPAWIKTLLALLALALLGGVAWLAFKGTSFFKGQVSGGPEEAPVEEPGSR